MLAQLAHDLDAVHPGHDDVEQDDVGANLLGPSQRFLAAGRGDDSETLVPQRQRHQLGDAGLVVRHEHQWLSAHLASLARSASAHAR